MIGQHIAFLGIDSIGKTTLARELVARLLARGLMSSTVTWKSAMLGNENRFVSETLRTLYVQSYAMMFSHCSFSEEKFDARELLQVSTEEFFSNSIEDKLIQAVPAANASEGLLAMALIEFAGNLFLHHHEIVKRRSLGEIIIQDSYGLKHVAKEILLMTMCPSEISRKSDNLSKSFLQFIEDAFSQLMPPDVGVFLRASPELAIKYGSGRPWGLVEDLRSLGAPGNVGFFKLQTECNSIFERYALKNGWHILDVYGQSVKDIADQLEQLLRL
jgi:hypothetical protein